MRRARRLAREKRDGDPKYDDAATLRAQRYLRAKRDGNEGEDFADIELAGQIHKGDQVGRLEIQARLLAGERPEEIAEQLGLLAEAVVAYEKLYFHVRDRLHAVDWIMKRAIKGKAFSTSRESRTDVLVKTLSYLGGVHVLELVFPYLTDKSGPLAEPVRLDTAESRTMEKARLAILVQSLPADARTSRRLTMGYPDFLELVKPVPKPVVRGVAVGLMGRLPGSLVRLLRKRVADQIPTHLEAPPNADEIARKNTPSLEVA
jgi:hypothetical protein